MKKTDAFFIFLSHIFLSGGRNDDQRHGYQFLANRHKKQPRRNEESEERANKNLRALRFFVVVFLRRNVMTVTDNDVLHARLRAFFSDKLSVEVSSVDADLVQTRILDSLAFVELFAYLEKEFETEISFDDIKIEDFHSIAKIAEYVDAHSPVLKV
jgi:acyl carrier protein